jgi:type I site-specific restriction endonuclease
VAGPLERDTCRDYVVPRLEASGWTGRLVEQYPVTDGKIVPVPRRGPRARDHRRDRPLRADYVLEIEAGFPIAVVEAKRRHKLPGDGLQQAMRYAQMLDLPFAYATNGRGIVEHDYDTGLERDLAEFPTPEELWRRYRAWKGIVEDAVADTLLLPFNRDLRLPYGRIKEPRYYQRVAIERALHAILNERRRRILLTLATGTGKTFLALQIIWKLWSGPWRSERKPRILYLADRNILVDQPIAREFQPVFGEAVWKIRGEAKTGREIYFALYQTLADSGEALGVFRDYPPDYFDLIVVDECHRGSARDESDWHAILEHFSPAVQIGMTATPKRAANIDTYNYFGDPTYTYSLAQGIEDGFLAPYRVRRVVLSPDALGWWPEPGQIDRFGREIPTVRNIVVFKPIGSIVEFKQIIGRGTRLYPDGDKLTFEIIDYSGATALVEYSDYLAGEVRRLYPSAGTLRDAWRTKPGREEIVAALVGHGISLEEAADRLGLGDMDAVDLLVHVAWNGPTITRGRRVRRLRTDHRDFFETFAPEARVVLEDLLDKYAEHGISQLDDLRVLEVPPLDRHGSVVDIASRFGGSGKLRSAIVEMEEMLYAA